MLATLGDFPLFCLPIYLFSPDIRSRLVPKQGELPTILIEPRAARYLAEWHGVASWAVPCTMTFFVLSVNRRTRKAGHERLIVPIIVSMALSQNISCYTYMDIVRPYTRCCTFTCPQQHCRSSYRRQKLIRGLE